MLLELEAIQKRFGGVTALRAGHLQVGAGEVHLLLGENGAGKSTLMRVVAGMVKPDSGVMRWAGRTTHFSRPVDAQIAGIAMVHQESLLAPHLTVAENIFLGREPRGLLGTVNRQEVLRRARRLIEEHRFPLQAEARVERLSPAGRQLVEICRAIAHNARLLIFDEPTSSLSEGETQEVFRLVRTLKQSGAAVIYITHRMEELRALGDRVTVLRDGETVFHGAMGEVSTDELIRYMVGRSFEAIYHRDPLPAGEALLRVRNLTRPGSFEDVSFDVRAGEIVGLAGLMGAGRTELCSALFGVAPAHAGEIHVGGVPAYIQSPRDAVKAGLALIPEDRGRAGLATALPVKHNLTLASLARFCSTGVVRRGAELDAVRRQVSRFQLKCGSPEQRSGTLSGGNQQKVVVAKWGLREPRVFLFDEPTRGIDIGAKAEVFHLMDELARSGAAILMVSSELPELTQVADRILIMRRGRLVAEKPRDATQEEIMRHAALE